MAWGCFYPRSPIACGYVFHPRAIGDPRGRGAVRASGAPQFELAGYIYEPVTCKHCALRAPTIFLVRMKIIRTKKTVMDKCKCGLRLRFCFADGNPSGTVRFGLLRLRTYATRATPHWRSAGGSTAPWPRSTPGRSPVSCAPRPGCRSACARARTGRCR
jgi:hypothetical protein